MMFNFSFKKKKDPTPYFLDKSQRVSPFSIFMIRAEDDPLSNPSSTMG